MITQSIQALKQNRNLARLGNGPKFLNKIKLLTLVLLLNSGLASAQPFATFVADPFNIQPLGDWMINTLVDIDNDGDLDLFSTATENSGGSTILYLENIGTANAPDFDGLPTPNPFGLFFIEALSTDFVDIDNDGDLDVFVTQGYGNGNIRFAENTGTVEMPVFGQAIDNPFGIQISELFVLAELADMDQDGDYDLLASTVDGEFRYFENVGTPEAPDFSSPSINPFGLDLELPVNSIVSNVFHIEDFDGDCDLDIFTYSFSDISASSFFFIENGGDATAPNFNAAEEMPWSLAIPVVNSQHPEFADLDNDGDFDLLLGVSGNGAYYYQNLLNNAPPTSEDASINGVSNEPYFFSFEDFPFTDPNSDFLQGVKITRLPDLGTLSLNDVPVSAGDLVPVAEIENLAFTPEMDATGSPYTDFDFQVTDGNNFDCMEYTMTINILLSSLSTILEDKYQVNVQPNPAHSTINLNVQLPKATKEVWIRISDSQGRIIKTLNQTGLMDKLNIDLDIDALPSGIYQVELMADSFRSATRFIKE